MRLSRKVHPFAAFVRAFVRMACRRGSLSDSLPNIAPVRIRSLLHRRARCSGHPCVRHSAAQMKGTFDSDKLRKTACRPEPSWADDGGCDDGRHCRVRRFPRLHILPEIHSHDAHKAYNACGQDSGATDGTNQNPAIPAKPESSNPDNTDSDESSADDDNIRLLLRSASRGRQGVPQLLRLHAEGSERLDS